MKMLDLSILMRPAGTGRPEYVGVIDRTVQPNAVVGFLNIDDLRDVVAKWDAMEEKLRK
jgi:hypothetical protein